MAITMPAGISCATNAMLAKLKEREGHDQLYFHFGTDRALRQGKWKLVSAKLGRWELYDMENDRTELHDLSGQEPARVQKMATELFRVAKEVDRLVRSELVPFPRLRGGKEPVFVRHDRWRAVDRHLVKIVAELEIGIRDFLPRHDPV